MAIDFNADQNRMGLALLAAAGPSARPMSFGQRMFMGLNQHDQYLAEKEQREQLRKAREAQLAFQQMQMAQMIQQQAERKAAQERATAIEGAYRGAIRTPQQQAMQQFGGPTRAAATAAPGMVPQVDQRALIESLAKVDPMTAFQMMLPKPDEQTVVAPGGTVWSKRDNKAVFTAPDKADKPPTSVQEYLYAQQNPGFSQWDESRRRAGASNVNVTSGEKPLVNAVAQGLGKQIDDSLAVAKSAGQSINTAHTLRAAVDSGKLVSGPGASFRVLGLQVGQMLGVGGKDGAEILANTRTAIQAMAQAELDAAQQMRGQGQITESERSIIRRAAAGDINDMTAPELRLLSGVMEKTARFKIGQHQRNVQGLSKIPGAAALMPFYQIEEPAPYAPPTPTQGTRKYNPATGRIE
ncbi:MAG: hypothetical protein IPK42_10320 [Betaproteobacteria bacterium]|nr:hypothetical protein [Betaproteobacteria bacterium]